MGAECSVCGHDMYDECAWCDREALIAALVLVGIGAIAHTCTGTRPATGSGFAARDPLCEACQVLARGASVKERPRVE